VKIVVCIPARYASTRFPGKVLAKDTGKYLIQHTWEQARKAKLPERVVIAADDEKIVQAAREFGAECVLTSPKHNSGTDRIAEAVGRSDADIVVNVQGDEPRIDPDHIDLLARMMLDNPKAEMATLAAPFAAREQVGDPNVVKVVVDAHGKAIYFSRSVIPYDRDRAGVGDVGNYLRHIGIYAYRRDFLLTITSLPQTPLEKLEKLEQLRAIENGYTILVGKVERTCEGIDTPEQYAEFVRQWRATSAGGTEMEVLGTVDKWFDDTFSHVQSTSQPMRQLDALLIGTLHCARKYCNGILVLLLPMHRHKLPAAALVRIFCEVCLKLLWCLQAPDKMDSPDKDSCWQRLRRWDYQRARERKKLLEKLCAASCAGQRVGTDLAKMHREAEQDVQQYEKENLRCIPDIAGICTALEEQQKGWFGVYPEWFQNYSRAVHLDMGLVRQMVQPSGSQILCFADTPEYDSLTLLNCCLAMACDINHMIRRHYGWDPDDMQREYESLAQSIGEMEKDNAT